MPPRRLILLSEVERQCRLALRGYEDAAAAVTACDSGRFRSSIENIFCAAAPLPAMASGAGLTLDEDSPLRSPDPSHPALPAILAAIAELAYRIGIELQAVALK